MKQYAHPAREAITLTGVLHALSDPIRLSVVKCLAANGDAMSCGSFNVPVHKSTMSHHIRILREAGVIQVRPEGTLHMNSLRRDDLNARFPGLLDSILRAAERVEQTPGAP